MRMTTLIQNSQSEHNIYSVECFFEAVVVYFGDDNGDCWIFGDDAISSKPCIDFISTTSFMGLLQTAIFEVGCVAFACSDSDSDSDSLPNVNERDLFFLHKELNGVNRLAG